MKCPLKFARYEFEGGEECVGAECGFYGSVCGAANGIDGETNGIRAGAPLVDEPPESDAIAHARWRWQYRPEDGDEVVMNEYNCKLLMSDLDAIADMIERDYVSREAYEDLCDEFVWTNAFLHRMGKKCGTKDVPSLVAYVDKLEAERDELKAKLEKEEQLNSDGWTQAFENANVADENARRHNALLDKYKQLEVERDEWKAKAEHVDATCDNSDGNVTHAKSAKRAAAVERLRELARNANSDDIVKAMMPEDVVVVKTNWTVEIDTLIDLLTDDDTHSKTEPLLTEQSELLSDEANSREKLEAYVLEIVKSGFVRYEELIALLDRQAAITERECFERAAKSDWLGQHLHAVMAENRELQAKLDELYESCDKLRDKNRALKAHIAKMQHGRHGWHVKGVKLQEQVDELTAKLRESNAEREQLREYFGIALDKAHDVLTLVDEFGNVYDCDEGLA